MDDNIKKVILENRRRMARQEAEDPTPSHPGQDAPSKDLTGIDQTISNVTGGAGQLTGDGDGQDKQDISAESKKQEADSDFDKDGLPKDKEKDDKDQSKKEQHCTDCGYMGEAASDGQCPNCGSKMESILEADDDEKDDKDDKEKDEKKSESKRSRREAEDDDEDDEKDKKKDESRRRRVEADDKDDDEEDDDKKEESKLSRIDREWAFEDEEEPDPEKHDMSLMGKTDTDKVTDLDPMTKPQGESKKIRVKSLEDVDSRITRMVERVANGEDADKVAEDLLSLTF